MIPPEEDHTLGAFVAANQFRRYGLWVHLAIGQSHDEVAETVAAQDFEMIGISGAGRRALESVRQSGQHGQAALPALRARRGRRKRVQSR